MSHLKKAFNTLSKNTHLPASFQKDTLQGSTSQEAIRIQFRSLNTTLVFSHDHLADYANFSVHYDVNYIKPVTFSAGQYNGFEEASRAFNATLTQLTQREADHA